VGRPVPLGNANGKHPERNISAGPVDWSGKLLHTHFQYQTVSLRLMKPAGLNAQGIPTAKGNGTWSAVQVARVLERLQETA
jgi:hypothetical protein